MGKNRLPLIILILFISLNGISQDLKWEWASMATSKGINRVFSSVSCGFHSDLYATCEYDSLICAGDTVIRHPEIHGENSINSAIIMYNYSGEFVDLVDLHTIPNGMLFNTSSGVDENENLNVFCSFQIRVFIQDTVINHCNSPYYEQPDILVVQLNKNREINWARTIGGTLSDQIYGQVVTPNGDIYILSDHVCGGSPPTVIDFFQQDTVITNIGFTAISKLDPNGILLWRNDFVGDFSYPHCVLGKDSLLYFWSDTRNYVTINNDTTITSGNPSLYLPLICCMDKNGTILKAEFAEFPISPRGLNVDINHNFCISVDIYDTLIIEKDTTIVPSGLTYHMIGKFDTLYHPIWYHVIPTVVNQQAGPYGFVPDGNDLVFASYSNRNVLIGDSVIEITGNRKAFVGIFDPEGNLKSITVSNISGEFPSANMLIDKCGNFILAGNIRGNIYLENDTANSYLPGRYDASLVKIKRVETAPLLLGPDTVGCMEYLLSGPPGYLEYSLNDSLMDQNTCLINKTGNYVFGCSDNGCWAYDTIFIGIHPGITLDIGSDTALYPKDSLKLTVPEVYDSIRWFDGADSFVKMIYGKDYSPGMLPVWAEVFSGPCSASDTLLVEIKSDFGVEEPQNVMFSAYPNPFRKDLTIEAFEPILKIRIIDCQGNICYSREFDNKSGKIIINGESLESGIYLLQIMSGNDKMGIVKVSKY